jgi:hypothetical protein
MASSANAVRLYLTEVAPFAFVVEGTNRYDGINIRIANELQKRTGIQLDVMVVPSPRHMVLFPADTEAYSISHRENFTDDDGLILAEVTQFPVVVVAKSGTAMTSFDDVIAQSQDKGIGMLRRMTYGTFGQDERVKKVDISTLENGLRMLDVGVFQAWSAVCPRFWRQQKNWRQTFSRHAAGDYARYTCTARPPRFCPEPQFQNADCGIGDNAQRRYDRPHHERFSE